LQFALKKIKQRLHSRYSRHYSLRPLRQESMVMEGQLRRSPRIMEQARQESMAKRAALTEAEREEILKKRRDAYHLWTIRDRHANKDGQEASTSSAPASRVTIGEQF
ncbi:hypothetical protein MKW98_005758, partial [Papaver atlanticum]